MLGFVAVVVAFTVGAGIPLPYKPVLVSKGVKEADLGPLDSAIDKESMKVFAQSEQRRRLAKRNEVVYTKRERKQ